MPGATPFSRVIGRGDMQNAAREMGVLPPECIVQTQKDKTSDNR